MRNIVKRGAVLLLCALLIQSHVVAKEGQQRFFGVGAIVEEPSPGIFSVKTPGKKAGEGFVHNPQQQFPTQKINTKIELKGKGTLSIKLEETDARGKYMKEKEIKVTLSDEWKLYELDLDLESVTSQIDLLVVTPSQSEVVFQFRNVKIQNRQ